MNLYIIITADIHPVGGMQLYTAGKSNFMEQIGWNVVVFHSGISSGKCAYYALNKYRNYAMPFFFNSPLDYSNKSVERIINIAMEKIPSNNYELIYIESQNDFSALWGELLASKLNAAHICFNCNELFRGDNKIYDKCLDFFWFKYMRRELIGLRPDSMCRLFEGYKKLTENAEMMFDALEPNPIQEISDKRILKLEKLDFNIMYLGRIAKGYVPNIIEGIRQFAKENPQNSIQFIVVGNAKERIKLIKSLISDCKNIKLELMGDMVPIPKGLYKYVDVAIAGAVCAEASAREGVPTIVADCENYRANGILGYTVSNSMYSEKQTPQTDFCTALRNVLITKEYSKNKYTFPTAISENVVYGSHLEFFNKADQSKKYYDILSIKPTIVNKPYTRKSIFRNYFKYFFPKTSKIILEILKK